MERLSGDDAEKFDIELMKPLPGMDDDSDAQWELDQLKQFNL